MPNVLRDDQKAVGMRSVLSLARGNPYKYKYPNGLDLRPGSELHEKIKSEVLSRANGSRSAMTTRFDSWRQIDRALTAYIRLSEKEEEEKSRDQNRPVSIVIPLSYAVLDTLLTYMVAAFLEEPYFRYEAAGPEDVLGAIMMEMLVAQQCRRAKVGLELHTMWRGGFSYGFNPVHIGYETKTAYRTVVDRKSVFSRLLGAMIPSSATEERRERVTVFDGGTVTALDPYMCLPDPNIPIHDIQRSEFFGWIEDTNVMSILASERDNDNYFNGRYLKHIDARSSMFLSKVYTGRDEKYGSPSRRTDVVSPADIIHMYIRIIPSDFGVGKEEYPEWWLFEVCGDNIVLRAQPLGLDHGQLPIAVSAPDFDGYSVSPVSRLEVIYGMQETMSWQFNSHIANVRKAMNDMLIVDPMLINMFDVTRPGPGKIMRLRRQAWGRGVENAVKQLVVSDVTSQHIPDTVYISDMAKFVTGAQDVVSGIRRRTSERVSATEAADTRTAALSRLEKAAKIISLQAHYDIAFQMGWNTRQLMKESTYVKILGDSMQVLAEEYSDRVRGNMLEVTPKDVDIDFDVVPGDGSLPGSGNPDIYIRLFQAVSQNPILLSKFDVVKLFKFGAKLAGAKNINEFILRGNVQANVMPTEEIFKQQEAGNMIPIEEAE